MTDIPLLDELVPDPPHRIAATVEILAPPEVVWRSLVALPVSALPAGFPLTLLRHLPGVVAHAERRVLGSDTFLDATPIPVVVAEPPRLLISAGVGQAWKPFAAPPPVLGLDGLRNWREPGWIAVAMSFALEPRPGGGTLLSTETRVRATDARTARVFAAYWWLIRAGSALIRREVLRAVRRDAERTAVGRVSNSRISGP
jgi:hypothetical protein